jgi:CubicO group peptidase (beta-lactamase class C family)
MNKRKVVAFGLLSLVGFGTIFAADHPPPAPGEAIGEASVDPTAPPSLTATDVNTWLDGFMPLALSNADIVGAVVTIVKDGQVLANRGFGYADLKARTPVDPNATLFRPGSISKLFTWTAVMQLVEAGKIDLDADVNTYIDFEIPPFDGAPITMRNILTHTTGFEEVVRDLIIVDPARGITLGDYLRRNMPQRIFAPGTMPAYSNYATALAGYVIERVSGESFTDYQQAHIFAPLGMKTATFVQPLPEASAGAMSQGYRNLKDGEPQPFEIIAAAPAGALSITGADMALFMNAHLANGAGLMSPETARLMHDTIDQQFPGVNSMALGFYRDDLNGQRIIAHGGDTQWFHSNLALLQDQNVGVYLSLNSGGAPSVGAQLLRWELMSAFVDRYFPAESKELVALPTAAEHGALVVGDYESARRVDSGPLLGAYFVGQTTVSQLPNGDLVGPGLPDVNEAPKHWREVEPWVWQAVGSYERMGVRVADGRVTAIAFEPLAFAIPSTRAPWWRAKSWLLPAVGFAFGVFLLTLLSWPIRAIARRSYRVPFPYERAGARLYRLGPVASLLAIVYLAAWAGFLAWLMESLTGTATAAPVLFGILYVAGIVPILVVAMTGYLVWVRWRTPTSKFARIWALLLLLSSIIVLWFAIAMRFFSFDFSY